MKKKDKIQQVIDLSEQKTTLLKELKESVIYEQKKYDLVRFDMGFNKSHILFNISKKTEVTSGRLDSIKSYINLRNIDITTIYNNIMLLS